LWFTDAAGTPLYAPYGLDIAIPAMMIGHLTIAGLAELVVTAGVVAYLQRSDVTLLASTGPVATTVASGGWNGSRRLWVIIATLMILSPLGLLAAGTAWGEWGVEDFINGTTEPSVAPLTAVPAGLERFASLWQAPLPDYVLPFVSNEQFSYILSAFIGTGLVILTFVLLGYINDLLRKRSNVTQ
jgi:cobalt/nickel transport system permease protein